MHQQQAACENIVGIGEIACDKQFLLFPQCFLFNLIIVSPYVHVFDSTSLFAAELEEPKIGTSGKGLVTLKKAAFENIWGWGKTAFSSIPTILGTNSKFLRPMSPAKACHLVVQKA